MRRSWGNKPKVVLSSEYFEHSGNLYVWVDRLPPYLHVGGRHTIKQFVLDTIHKQLFVGWTGSSKKEFICRDDELFDLARGLLADPKSPVEPLLDKLQELYPPFAEVVTAYMEQK